MSDVIQFKPRPRGKAVEKMAAEAAGQRVAAIDILRGLCVAGMILVAYAGDWSHRFKVLNHADWHGLALADMIFPGFLLCAGMAIPLSLAKRGEDKGKIALHIAWRAAALIVLGIVLNFLATPDIARFRIPGILQRIGLCYGLAGALALVLARREGKGLRVPILPVAGAMAGVLIVYGAILMASGHFDATSSLPAVIDRAVFTTHYMWPYGTTNGQVTYDPEGLLSTLGALGNVLLGVAVAAYMRRVGVKASLATLAFVALLLFVLGAGLDGNLPIIKKIWTPSFTLLSGGFTLPVFVLLAVIADVAGWTAWAVPLRVLGANATAAFAAISLIDIVMKLPLGSGRIGHDVLVKALDSVIPDVRLESLAYSAILLAVVLLALTPLYIKRWYLKF